MSYAYQKGQFSRIPIAYDDATGTLTIGARQGRFPGMVERNVFNVRWMSGPSQNAANFEAAPDQSVTYTGAAVTVKRP